MFCEACKNPIKKRTNKQNRALHLWFRLLAEALNGAGYDMRSVIRESIDIPWTENTVKEYLWRPVQMQFLQEISTTKLATKDIDKVFDILNRVIGERTGIYVPFPSVEDLMDNYEE